MISEEKVREVAERVSIVDVVSEYVQLRRAGANHLGLCPFHAEKTPSFNVNPAREIFHCFGCGVGGNVFSFVMRIEGISFPEAVKLLARKAGVEIEERQLSPAEKQAQSERQIFLKINDLTADYYRSVLEKSPEAAEARAYLEKRAAGGEIAEAYCLGFATERRDGLVRHLKARGIDPEAAQKLGIIRRNEYGFQDLFRNRLIFPIRDARGQVIAFAGRVLDGSLPKYINSPESPLYHKGTVLYGLDMALPSIRTEKSIIIVEGYFDHLALYRAGIRNVAATCGTALTTNHTTLIKRHADRVFTLFDSDEAGRKATIRSMELFLEQRLPAYVITLPAGDDPDSFLAGNPPEEFRTRQNRARPAFEYFVRTLLERTPLDSVDSKVRVIDELAPRFRKIVDPLERDLYEKEICRLLGISAHAFRKRMGGMQINQSDLHTNRPSQAPAGDPRQETLLALICGYPEARAEVASYGPGNLFDGHYLELARLLLASLNDDDDAWKMALLAEKIEQPELQTILSRLLVSDGFMNDINWRDVFDHCRRGREKVALRLTHREIAARLALLEPESQEYLELLQQGNALLHTRKSKL